MSSEPLDISDSDNDLPDLSDIFPGIFENPSLEISDGDIVWAKYKKLYWPALVKRVYQKEKKVAVWYTDQPGTTFKLPLSNVVSFNDTEKSEEFRNQAIAARCVEAHDGLKRHATEFLSRQSLGFKDDPLKYFDQTYPFFLVENFLKNNPDANKESFMSLKIPPLYLKGTVPVASTSKITTAPEDDVEFEPEKDLSGDEVRKSDMNYYSVEASGSQSSVNEEDPDIGAFNKHSLLNAGEVELGPASKQVTYEDKIVEYITSGKADKYLTDIFHKNISSFYHDFYLKCIKSDRKLLNLISYGPFNSLDSLQKIIMYLISYYETVSSTKTKKRVKRALSYCARTPTTDASFISFVWLPESIICAISDLKSLSLTDAINLFHEHSSLKSIYEKYAKEKLYEGKPGCSTLQSEEPFASSSIANQNENNAGSSRSNSSLFSSVLEEVNETIASKSDSVMHFSKMEKKVFKKTTKRSRKTRQ